MIEPIEYTYFDVMDVYRMKDVMQPEGHYEQERTLHLSNIPCALAKAKMSTSTYVNDDNLAQDSAKIVHNQLALYCNPKYDIKYNDELHITKYGRLNGTRQQQVTCTTGEPILYDSHQYMMVREYRTG